MASVMPKFKLYMFISFIAILLNISFHLMNMAYTDSFNILLLLSGFGTGFVPFLSTISIVLSPLGLPLEVIALVGVLTAVLSIVQIYLIAVIIVNMLPLTNV